MASTTQLKRSNPEAEGIPSSAVLEFIGAVEQHVHPMDALQGFMLLRNGNVVAEGWWTPYGRQCPHPLQSLSKSFTSAAIGLAVQEGLLTVSAWRSRKELGMTLKPVGLPTTTSLRI